MDRKSLESVVYKTIVKEAPTIIVNIDELTEPKFKMRMEFDEKHCKALMKSIQNHGQLQPILLWLNKEGKLEVYDGWHRLEAMKRLGMKEIEAKLIKGELAQAMVKAFHSQTQRKDMTPLEIARWAEIIKRETGMRWEDIATLFGISKRHLERCRKVYETEYYDIREAVREGKMSLRRALREIKKRENPSESLYESNPDAWWNEPVECACCGNAVPRNLTKRVCVACLDKMKEEHAEESGEAKSIFDREYSWQEEVSLDPDYSIESYGELYEDGQQVKRV